MRSRWRRRAPLIMTFAAAGLIIGAELRVSFIDGLTGRTPVCADALAPKPAPRDAFSGNDASFAILAGAFLPGRHYEGGGAFYRPWRDAATTPPRWRRADIHWRAAAFRAMRLYRHAISAITLHAEMGAMI